MEKRNNRIETPSTIPTEAPQSSSSRVLTGFPHTVNGELTAIRENKFKAIALVFFRRTGSLWGCGVVGGDRYMLIALDFHGARHNARASNLYATSRRSIYFWLMCRTVNCCNSQAKQSRHRSCSKFLSSIERQRRSDVPQCMSTAATSAG